MIPSGFIAEIRELKSLGVCHPFCAPTIAESILIWPHIDSSRVDMLSSVGAKIEAFHSDSIQFGTYRPRPARKKKVSQF